MKGPIDMVREPPLQIYDTTNKSHLASVYLIDYQVVRSPSSSFTVLRLLSCSVKLLRTPCCVFIAFVVLLRMDILLLSSTSSISSKIFSQRNFGWQASRQMCRSERGTVKIKWIMVSDNQEVICSMYQLALLTAWWVVSNGDAFTSTTDTLNTRSLVHSQTNTSFGSCQSSQSTIRPTTNEQWPSYNAMCVPMY